MTSSRRGLTRMPFRVCAESLEALAHLLRLRLRSSQILTRLFATGQSTINPLCFYRGTRGLEPKIHHRSKGLQWYLCALR